MMLLILWVFSFLCEPYLLLSFPTSFWWSWLFTMCPLSLQLQTLHFLFTPVKGVSLIQLAFNFPLWQWGFLFICSLLDAIMSVLISWYIFQELCGAFQSEMEFLLFWDSFFLKLGLIQQTLKQSPSKYISLIFSNIRSLLRFLKFGFAKLHNSIVSFSWLDNMSQEITFQAKWPGKGEKTHFI